MDQYGLLFHEIYGSLPIIVSCILDKAQKRNSLEYGSIWIAFSGVNGYFWNKVENSSKFSTFFEFGQERIGSKSLGSKIIALKSMGYFSRMVWIQPARCRSFL